VALLILINAPSWQSASGAIMHRFGLSRDDGRRLVDELERRHMPIAKHFQSGAGCRLQWYDSRMADRILIEATRQGIPVLPIHDSFITLARLEGHVRELMEMAFRTEVFGSRATPPILLPEQELREKQFHIRREPSSVPASLSSLSDPSLSVLSLSSSFSFLPLSNNGISAFFGDDCRLTVSGRIAVINARRRRAIRQYELADLVGISQPTLSNILAGRHGASPHTAERIAEIIATTPALERQPFLPGLAA
jgi:DNA-binding XRE family transcriptional regulator